MRFILLDNEDIWIAKKENQIDFLFEHSAESSDTSSQVKLAQDLYAVECASLPTAATQKINLRQLFECCGDGAFQLAGRARQLLHWRATHQFCGVCGQPTRRHASELAMVCEACDICYYPRINPVVISLIHRQNEILLLRRADPEFSHFWSLAAGFVEAGESLEEAAHREIKEETGVKVCNLRNAGSQQWPFPNNLMIGFFAEYATGEPRPDGVEISEVRWFDRETLPRIPSQASIARKMIDHFFSTGS